MKELKGETPAPERQGSTGGRTGGIDYFVVACPDA
jgi:hypothetical protein